MFGFILICVVSKLKIVGMNNLTTPNKISIAAICDKFRDICENSGIAKKINPAASTNPTPLGRTGVLSRIEIMINKNASGKSSIGTLSAKKQ